MAPSTAVSFALFDTAIGRCAMAWSERGIAMVLLPESDDAERNDAALLARLLRRHPGAREATPPGGVAHAIEGIAALVGGDRRDLTGVVLDLDGVSEFDRSVYAVARTIGPGETLTYGAIAAQLGEPDPRRIGAAMGRNPCPVIVPCHRVVAAGGTGGFSAPGGAATKRRLLAIEGAGSDEPTLFDQCGGLAFAMKERAGRRRRGG
jgi:methylated-DNA-[protein]-cysteine S-methyltransferase